MHLKVLWCVERKATKANTEEGIVISATSSSYPRYPLLLVRTRDGQFRTIFTEWIIKSKWVSDSYMRRNE